MLLPVEEYSVMGHNLASCNKLAMALKDRYVLYRQKYVKIRDPEKMTNRHRSPTSTEYGYLDDPYFIDHLRGDYAVGVFAGPHATKFICIDIDISEHEVVHKVVDTLAGMGIPRDRVYVSLSGGKGYHVDIFVRDKVFNNKARLIYEQMIEISGLNRRKVEFWPTPGHAVKLPLGVHQNTHERCWFVDRETLEPIEDLEYIYETKFVDESIVNEIADRYSKRKQAELYRRGRVNIKKPGGTATPPGFDVTLAGTRHVMQRKYAIWLRQHGAEFDDLVDGQMAWYERQDQALISSEFNVVLAEAYGIADWCVKHVYVNEYAHDDRKAPIARIDQRDIAYVLSSGTPAYRRVAFFLLIYCRRYGESKVAHQTIADKVGVTRSRVIAAIKWMRDNGRIIVGSNKKSVGVYSIKDSNKYTLPDDVAVPLIPKRFQRAEFVDIDDWLTEDTFGRVYARTLSAMCTNAYLKKIMKPKEYEKYLEEANDQLYDMPEVRECGSCDY